MTKPNPFKDQRLKAFGLRLQTLRKAQNLSQDDLAAASDLDRTYISGIERGIRNVALKNIFNLADALKLNPKEFFSEF